MNSISILKVIAVLSLLTLTTPVFAEDYSGGATIVPVAENLPQSRFNLKTDAASIYIEKAILIKIMDGLQVIRMLLLQLK